MQLQHIITALVTSIGLVSGQSVSDLPSCSLSCLISGIASTGCATTDLACSCGKSAQLSSSTIPCIASECNAVDQSKAITVLEGICANVGISVTISLPGVAPSSIAAPAVSSTAAVSSSDLPTTTTSAVVNSGVSISSSVSPSPSSTEAKGSVTTSSAASTTALASSKGTVSTSASPSVVSTSDSTPQMLNTLGFLTTVVLSSYFIM